MADNLKGYKGKNRKLLENHDLKIWDILQITTDNTTFEGILLPRNEYSQPDYIEIKLENNYNVGINVSQIKSLKK